MKATKSKNFNPRRAECIANDPSADGDDQLYRTRDGHFFLIVMHTYLDGRKLLHSESLEELAPEIAPATAPDLEEACRQRQVRLRVERVTLPLTTKQAMIWCIKTQIPECFRSYLLDTV
jgi:hypothetical protein